MTSRKGVTGYMWNNLGTAYEHLDQLDEARTAFESGSALGSMEARSSRNRLEGVDTIVVMRQPVEDATDDEHTYETHEPLPEAVVEDPTEGEGDDASVDEPTSEASDEGTGAI